MARGAVEVAPGHYPLIVAVHAAWLISLWVFGHDQPVNVVALAVYLVLQGFRFWVMWTLGSRWTTRIIVLPGEPLVSAGPYRFLSHPNYAVVAGEIAVLPLVAGSSAAGRHLHDPQRRGSRDPHPGRKPRARGCPQARTADRAMNEGRARRAIATPPPGSASS